MWSLDSLKWRHCCALRNAVACPPGDKPRYSQCHLRLLLSKYMGTISVLLFLSPTSSQRHEAGRVHQVDSDALYPDSESNNDYRATYTTSGLILCRLDHIKPLLSLLKPRIYLLNLLISACQLLQASSLSKAVVKLEMDMNSLIQLKHPAA